MVPWGRAQWHACSQSGGLDAQAQSARGRNLGRGPTVSRGAWSECVRCAGADALVLGALVERLAGGSGRCHIGPDCCRWAGLGSFLSNFQIIFQMSSNLKIQNTILLKSKIFQTWHGCR
jgi:hypothetical protein